MESSGETRRIKKKKIQKTQIILRLRHGENYKGESVASQFFS